MRCFLVFLVLPGLVLGSMLSAQATVSPAAAATGLGNTNNNIPFSWRPTGYQQVHSKSSFSNQNARLVKLLRFRMAKNFTNRRGATIDVELFMGVSPHDATKASSVFANNIAKGSEVNVFKRKKVNLPTVPNNAWAVAPFPFDRPFPWPGTHLEWRANVYGNSNNNKFFTYPLDAFGGYGSSVRTGSKLGCRSANGGVRPASMSGSVAGPGGFASFFGLSQVRQAGIRSLLTLGTSSTNWGGIKLPFDMTPLGAPGCWIVNDVAATLATVTDSLGIARIRFNIPNNPGLQGQKFLTQFAFLQPGANPFGVFTSDGRTNTIGVDPGISRIYAVGNPGGTGGSLQRGFGLSIALD